MEHSRLHPVSGKLEALLLRELELSPFRLNRNHHVTSALQLVALLRGIRMPGIQVSSKFHALLGMALILGSASTAGKGLATYGILYRLFRDSVNAFDKELHDGRAPLAQATTAA